MRTIVAYVASLVAFVAVDLVWLTVMSSRLYRPVIGELMAPKINGLAAVAFYLIYLFGVTFLAVLPALREGSGARAAINGLVLGVVAYATYDLTNEATLKVWATRISLADIGWGAFATTLAALAGYHAVRLVAR